jgi:hypothetical protein
MFLFLVIFSIVCMGYCQDNKLKIPTAQKLHIQSKYTVMTGVLLSNASMAFGLYSQYNYQIQVINLNNNHSSQIIFLTTNYNEATTPESRAIWLNDITMENDNYDKQLKINKQRYGINLILASFFFFAGNVMIISGIKNMVVTPNGIGIVYNF